MCLSLDLLIVILLQLADKRQHLRQQAQPLLAQAIRQRLLALDRCEPHRRRLRAHRLQDRAVQLLVVVGRVRRSRQLDDRGHQL